MIDKVREFSSEDPGRQDGDMTGVTTYQSRRRLTSKFDLSWNLPQLISTLCIIEIVSKANVYQIKLIQYFLHDGNGIDID